MGYCGWCPYLNKWYTFVASIAYALCCGLTYTFPVWSGVLKDKFDLDQEHLQLIGAAANAGGYCSIIAGLVYDSLERHKKFGPRFVLVIGLATNALGYLGLWAAVKGFIRAGLWHLVALAALAANGGTWGDCAVLVTNVRNFPSSRGSVVGILKAAIGLSGSLFAAVYSGAFSPDKESFLLFLALAPVGVGLAALFSVNHCSFVQKSEMEEEQHVFTTEGRFIFALQALGTLAVYLITTAALSSLYPLSRSVRLLMMTGAGLLLLPLLLVPYGSGGLLSQKAAVDYAVLSLYSEEDDDQDAAQAGLGSVEPGKPSVQQPLLGPESMRMQQDELGAGQGPSSQPLAAPASAPPASPQPQLPNLGPVDCLRSSTFWLLFLVLVIGLGSGLTLLNNLAQIVKALGGSGLEATPVLVSLFSVSNCAGRMAFGYVPERLLHARGTPRLLFLPAVSALMAFTCLGLAFGRMALLYPLAALAGVSFGGHWSLFPALVSELFGLTRFAANYTLVQLAPAVGSFGLAAGLAGYLYERALARHGTAGNTCVGQDCFQLTFIVLAALGLVSTCCGAVIYRRHRGLYEWHARQLHTYDEEVQHGSQGVSRRV